MPIMHYALQNRMQNIMGCRRCMADVYASNGVGIPPGCFSDFVVGDNSTVSVKKQSCATAGLNVLHSGMFFKSANATPYPLVTNLKRSITMHTEQQE